MGSLGFLEDYSSRELNSDFRHLWLQRGKGSWNQSGDSDDENSQMSNNKNLYYKIKRLLFKEITLGVLAL